MVSTKLGLAFAIGSLLLASVQGQCTPTCDATGGDCVGTTCYCKAGYYGAGCTDTCTPNCTAPSVCIGATSCGPCSPVCVSTGTCATVGTAPTCKCNTGYYGNDCASEYCNPNPCKNSGTCSNTDGTCTCTAGWTGPICDIAATACGSGKCATGKGDCESDVCYCKALSYGPHCAETCAACSTSGQVCSGASTCAACDPACDTDGGVCTTVGSAPTCKCNTGYSGDTCADGVAAMSYSLLAIALTMFLHFM